MENEIQSFTQDFPHIKFRTDCLWLLSQQLLHDCFEVDPGKYESTAVSSLIYQTYGPVNASLSWRLAQTVYDAGVWRDIF